MEFYEAEVQRLQKRIEDLSGVSKILDLEQQLKESVERRNELQRTQIELKKVSKGNGETLERLESGDAFSNQTKALITEIRIWKDKQDRLEQRHMTQAEVYEKQQDKTSEYMDKIDQLKEEIEQEEGKQRKKEPEKSGSNYTRQDIQDLIEERDQIKEEYEKMSKDQQKEAKEKNKEIKRKQKIKKQIESKL